MKKTVFNEMRRQIKAHGDSITATQLVTKAKSQRSPLHEEFEWDNEKAGHEYRLMQARKLIKAYSVKVEAIGEKIIHVPPAVNMESREGEYRPIRTVVNVQSDWQRACQEVSSKLASAKRAMELLERAANENTEKGDDTAALIALAIKGMETAGQAIGKLH